MGKGFIKFDLVDLANNDLGPIRDGDASHGSDLSRWLADDLRIDGARFGVQQNGGQFLFLFRRENIGVAGFELIHDFLVNIFMHYQTLF
ncbi:hypothetical protein SDC9_204531 [bioreactor metagenome]|uniref:Uncharacterized protein n=1 Tax=bioreactor metagenome TaxID=1076179 RepID=A0A645IZI7_9ZZZZ